MTTASDFNPATFDPESFNPHAPDFIKNPYPYYAWFRHNAPVFWVGAPYNSFWLFRYDDVETVLCGTDTWLKNSPVSHGKPPPGFDVLGNLPEGIFTLDNPRHDQVRSQLEPLFHDAISDIDRVAAALASAQLATFGQRRRVELIEDFALPMPAQALCHVLGVPAYDWPVIMQWVLAILLADDPTRGIAVLGAGGTSTMALHTYYHALIRGGGVNPVDSRMIALMKGIIDREPAFISSDEVIANAVTMSIAGYYSTTFLLGTGTLNLINNPSAMDQLRASVQAGETALLNNAVGEMLRYDGPVQLIDRYAAQETTIRDKTLPKGQKVTVVTGSANWDETVFDAPERFDIERNTEKMLSFGDGIHRCLGEPLARKTTPAALKALLTELPPFELGGLPQWQTDPYLRAVSNLPISFG
jgi:cytochrome P450